MHNLIILEAVAMRFRQRIIDLCSAIPFLLKSYQKLDNIYRDMSLDPSRTSMSKQNCINVTMSNYTQDKIPNIDIDIVHKINSK